MDDAFMQSPLFAALDPEGAAALRASLAETDVAKGEVLFIEGEPGDRMYVIVDGKVKLGQTSTDGRESLLGVLGPGEMFGELSLFDPGLRTSTATALTDVTVLGLGHDQLKPWLAGRPEVAAALLQALARRIRRANEAMADLVFSDVPGRVAKALMDLGEKFGTVTPEGLMVTHDMTHALERSDRILMMHRGQVILDIEGEEKDKLDPAGLVERFEHHTGGRLGDREILSGG